MRKQQETMGELNTKTTRWTVALLVLLTSLLASSPRTTGAAQDSGFEFEIERRAGSIVEGTVGPSEFVETADGSMVTLTEVTVTDDLKDNVGNTVIVLTPGGRRDDGLVQFVWHTESLTEGSTVRIALDELAGPPVVGEIYRHQDTNFAVVGGADGQIWLGGSVQIERFEALVGEPLASARAASDFTLSGRTIKGLGKPVPYRINATNSGVAAEPTRNAVRSAFATWENDGASTVDFQYAGTSSLVGPAFDDVNLISWGPVTSASSSDTVAQLTEFFFSSAPSKVLEFDITFDISNQFAIGSSPFAYDIQSVIVHEIGHVVGLGHVGTTSEVMFLSINEGEIDRKLGKGDLMGMRTLWGFRCEGRVVTLRGTTSDDTLTGTNGPDVIQGRGGNDTIRARRGNDVVCAGSGKDVVIGARGDDQIDGGAGRDRLLGGTGNDTIGAGKGNDRVFGGTGNDALKGGGGDDRLDGGPGSDSCAGGPGADTKSNC